MSPRPDFIERETFFDPDPARARRLDARMRERLADSLAYIGEQAANALQFDSAKLQRVLGRMREEPVHPQVFGAYYELVLALDDEDLTTAQEYLNEILDFPEARPPMTIIALGAAEDSKEAARYQRLVDTDPTAPFKLLPPPADLAQAMSGRIEAAMALMDRANPELAGEIRTIVRDVILAVGPNEEGQLTFDGASSFMLWGALFLNAESHETEIAMVQALAHETAHSLLFGLCTDGSLVENEDEERFESPLRQDPRPMDGIYHATFVTARMHQALARLVESGHLDEAQRAEAERELESNVRLFADGLATVERHARLTPLGAKIMAGAKGYMAAYLD